MKALAYYRTSSATNTHGDSLDRQRAAVTAYALANSIEVVGEYYDAAVSGADPIDQRPGFLDMLARIQSNGVRTILVENASRFARDLIVQETGYAMLVKLGISPVAVDDPDAFTGDTPTSKMVRQILGAVSEFEKANLVAKLRGARDRRSAGKAKRIEGRKGYDQTKPAMVAEAKRLRADGLSLERIGMELASAGHLTRTGRPFGPAQVKHILAY